jgi:phosphoglycolate phosphatase-like HAD superfamily hydrolase
MTGKEGVQAVVFDCDGVLLDSNEMKVACFREAVEAAGFTPRDVERFSAFQRANFGTSRFRLFDTLLGWELERRPPVDQKGLVALYAERLRHLYVAAAATPGMRAVVGALSERMPAYVVSGSDEAELRDVLAMRGDAAMFRVILGSPRTKVENLLTLFARPELAGLPRGAIVFVGDAEADWKAARETGCRFVYMDHFSTVQDRMRALAAEEGFPLIKDLRGLPAALGLPQRKDDAPAC